MTSVLKTIGKYVPFISLGIDEETEKAIKNYFTSLGSDGAVAKKFIQYLEWIEDGVLGYQKHAEGLVENDGYLSHFIEQALKGGAPKKLKQYIGWLRDGDFYWEGNARELAEEYGLSTQEIDQALMIGEQKNLRESTRENSRKEFNECLESIRNGNLSSQEKSNSIKRTKELLGSMSWWERIPLTAELYATPVIRRFNMK